MGWCDIGQRGKMLSRNDQQMDGRLRVDVLECQQAIFFSHDLRGDLPPDDAAEQAITFRHVRHALWCTDHYELADLAAGLDSALALASAALASSVSQQRRLQKYAPLR